MLRRYVWHARVKFRSQEPIASLYVVVKVMRLLYLHPEVKSMDQLRTRFMDITKRVFPSMQAGLRAKKDNVAWCSPDSIPHYPAPVACRMKASMAHTSLSTAELAASYDVFL